ncbi:MAG: AAA family ATPase [Planctomycetia bacterium]|nr:AAA family ATPase [Planctomycetia bacterium]
MGNYFGLQKRPFIAEPVPEGFCPFGSAEHARAQVSRCIARQEGVALVSGFSGTGKTLLCRALQKQFQDSMPTVLLNGENLPDPQTFFETLLSRLELPFDSRNLATMRDTLCRHLEHSPRFRSGLLLLVDDAQATAIRVYEEMRQLLDRSETLGQGVRVVLVGDMSLEEKLTFEKLNSFSKRITVRAFLEKFNRSETEAFLKMELEESGDTKGIFSREVCREIYRFADGVPRLTNQLADYLLIFGLETAREMDISGKGIGKTKEEKEESKGEEEGESRGETWDADPIPIDTGDSGIFDAETDVVETVSTPEIGEVTDETVVIRMVGEAEKKGTETEEGELNLFQVEFTPVMVQRAWNRMQNFSDDHGEEVESPSLMGNMAGKLGENAGNSEILENSSNIVFGSLDDADEMEDGDDSAHMIDFSPVVSSPEEATGKWAYEELYDELHDELQEIRDTVDELNSIPEEWETSATKNSREKTSTDTAVTSAVNPVTSVMAPITSVTPVTLKTPVGTKIPTGEDLFDPRREVPIFNFPKSEDSVIPAWQPPHYTARRTEGIRNTGTSGVTPRSGGNSVSGIQVTSENVSEGYSSKKLTFSDIGTHEMSETVRKRNMTVDDIINDAIMEDTVHSMKLLQRILNALREENLQRPEVPQPANYWLNMQGLIKDSMRTIATSRHSQMEELRKDEELQNRVRVALAARNGYPGNSHSGSENPDMSSGGNLGGNSSVNSWENMPKTLNTPCVISSADAAPRGPQSREVDFYRPESLLEEGTLRYDAYGPPSGSRFNTGNGGSVRNAGNGENITSVGNMMGVGNPVMSVREGNPGVFSVSETSGMPGTSEVAGGPSVSGASGTSVEGFTEVALLRSLLQDENVRNSIDQEKLSQIISQLRTMSQIS